MSHYYKDGLPVYELPCSTKEGMRAVTIRDVKKLNLDVGVTTISQILDKPGLMRYKFQQLIMAAFREPWQKDGEEFEDYVDRLVESSKKDSQFANNKGSELHNYLEDYFNGKELSDFSQEVQSFIRPVIEEVFRLCDINIFEFGESEIKNKQFIAERSFSHYLGFGGKVDLLYNRKNIIIDFKTKNTTDLKKFYSYIENLLQLSAYKRGIGGVSSRCINLYFSSVEPNIIKSKEWTQDELEKGWIMFKHLLNYWQLSNGLEARYDN